MFHRIDIIDYKNVTKAVFTYLMTIGAVFAARTSGFLWSNVNEEETESLQTSLKRSILQANQTQSLPLVEVVEVGRFNLSSDIQDIIVQNDIAYIAAGENGFYIVNVTGPANPILLGNYKSVGFAHQLNLAGSYVYVAYDTAGLKIIDTSNKSNPLCVGTYMMVGDSAIPVSQLVYTNTKVFISDKNTGAFDVVDVTDPTQVFRVFFNTFDSALGVTVVNTTVYVASNYAGVQVFNASDPTNAFIINNWPPTGFAESVRISNNIEPVNNSV